MIDNAASVADGSVLECDLAVIGAGPVGLTLARELTGSGVDVIVLEAAGAETELPAETGKVPGPFGTYDLGRTRARGFGGSSGIFLRGGWRARPIDPIDLRARSGFPMSGWPFSHDDLLPYFRRAQTLLDLGEYDYDGRHWIEGERGPTMAVLGDGIDTSLFQFCPADHIRSWAEHLADANAPRVLLEAVVTEIAADPTASRVEGLRVTARRGGRFTVQARAYVLACGGIDNARLLLASSPQGLGNREGLVGRYFMEHFHVDTGVFWPANDAVAAQMGFYKQHTTPSGTDIQGALRLSEEVVEREQLLNALVWLFPGPQAWATVGGVAASELLKSVTIRRWPPGLPAYLRAVANDVPSVATMALRKVLRFPLPERGAIITIESEQVPNPDSRVTLSQRLDAFGVPIPDLHWAVKSIDLRSIRRTQELVDAALRRQGLGHLERFLGEEDPPAHIGGGCHHMGTTRMHEDPAQGVVDADGRVHGMDNLFVGGSSVFPTSGSSNPTFTIVALAIRLADHLRAELAERRTPKVRGKRPRGAERSSAARQS